MLVLFFILDSGFESEINCVGKTKYVSPLFFFFNPTPSFSSDMSADEIAFLEGMTIVYKNSIDLFFYVVGSAQENEVLSILFFLN